MDIYLSKMDRSQIIKLPVIPSEIIVSSPSQNETFSTISQGEIKLIGPEGLESLSLSSYFPVKDYPFLKDRSYRGMEYVDIIKDWKKRKFPIRLVITGQSPLVNTLCAIENLEYGPRDGTGDIYYTLALGEFKMLPLQKRNV